jgi:hypothetical protein
MESGVEATDATEEVYESHTKDLVATVIKLFRRGE